MGAAKNKRSSTSSSSKPDAKKAKKSEAGGLKIEVSLAKSWKEKDNVSGWLMSEKLDGMRCVWDGKATLWTRNGNEVYAPKSFVNSLPRGIALDGELFMGRGMCVMKRVSLLSLHN